MKNLFCLALIFALNKSLFSQIEFRSNDSLAGFDYEYFADFSKSRNLNSEESIVFISKCKRDYINKRYNLKSNNLPEADYSLIAKTASAICLNEDFEEASLSSTVPGTIVVTTTNGINGWIATSGATLHTGNGSCSLTGRCNDAPNAIKVIAPGPLGLTDPIIGTALKIHSVFGNNYNTLGSTQNGMDSYGNWFLKLNDQSINGNALNQIKKVMQISSSNYQFTYAYLLVVQTAHCCCDNPGFSITFKDTVGNSLSPSLDYTVGAPPASTVCGGPVNCSNSTAPYFYSLGGYNYTKWDTNTVNLTPWMGSKVIIEVTAFDCDYGPHLGYAYFDAQCGPALSTNISLVNQSLHFKIYPNPTSGNFNIDIAKDIINGEIELRNILGQTVHKQIVKQGNNSVKTENLAKGIYNYSVLQNKEVVSVGKVVIE